MVLASIGGYTLLKFLHVSLAIIAVGTNATYGIWTARARRHAPEHLEFALRGVKLLDDRVANPAYGLLLVTGLLTAWSGGWDILHTTWLKTGLGLYVVAVGLAAAGYSPALRHQIETLVAHGPSSPQYLRYDRRARILGIVLAVVIGLIVFFMVTKPG